MSSEETVKTTAPAKRKAAPKTTKVVEAKTSEKTAEAKAAAPAKAKAPRATKAKTAKTVEVEAAKPVEAAEAVKPTTQVAERTIPVPTHEEIALLAVQYWAERGYQHGNHEQDWFRAEQELRGLAS